MERYYINTPTHPDDQRRFTTLESAYSYAQQLVEDGHSPIIGVYRNGKGDVLNWAEFHALYTSDR